MGFIFKHNQPFFPAAIDFGSNDNAAGVNFIRLIQVCELPPFFQFLHPNEGNIHQADFPSLLLLAVQVFPGGEIFPESRFNRSGKPAFFYFHFLNVGHKGCMPAVIGPVGVQDPDFCNGWISFFTIPKVLLAENQVFQAHGQSQVLQKRMEFFRTHGGKPCQEGHIFRDNGFHFQGFRFYQGSFPRFHRVDAVVFYLGQVLIRNISL